MTHIETDCRRQRISVVITDEGDAWEIAGAFGPRDGFAHDMASAIREVWPDDDQGGDQ